MQVQIPGFNLQLTANSGQCFRFLQLSASTYHLIAGKQELFISQQTNDLFNLDCSQSDFRDHWQQYFDLDTDYQSILASIPKDGGYLQKAANFAGGLRILQQDAFETVVSFIISQRKTIPAIKSCVSKLSERFGEYLPSGKHAFPSAEALARAEPGELAACGLGYRVGYVSQTARMIAQGVVNLQDIHCLDDAQAKQALLQLPGVGNKVADCILLFAYHRLGAFPVDVWIERVLQEHYPQGFPFHVYPGHAGVLQQYLFCYARHLAGR